MKSDVRNVTSTGSIDRDKLQNDDSIDIDSTNMNSNQATNLYTDDRPTQLDSFSVVAIDTNITESSPETPISALTVNYLISEFRNNRPQREYLRLKVSL
jgi:hypothetical protein